ncbi:hypothetical protein BH20ACT5_BH20ACT5_06540 [soil metagenome]
MLETYGPGLDAEVAYRRERLLGAVVVPGQQRPRRRRTPRQGVRARRSTVGDGG